MMQQMLNAVDVPKAYIAYNNLLICLLKHPNEVTCRHTDWVVLAPKHMPDGQLWISQVSDCPTSPPRYFIFVMS